MWKRIKSVEASASKTDAHACWSDHTVRERATEARYFIAASAERLEWPGKGPIAAIHLARLATLSEREAQLTEEAEVLRQRTRNLNAKVRRSPVRRLGYPALISHALNGVGAPQNG